MLSNGRHRLMPFTPDIRAPDAFAALAAISLASAS